MARCRSLSFCGIFKWHAVTSQRTVNRDVTGCPTLLNPKRSGASVQGVWGVWGVASPDCDCICSGCHESYPGAVATTEVPGYC
jgi:hypothetical protein